MSAALDDFEAVAGELAAAGEAPMPGSWRSALRRPDAPGAALDGQPWARSWGTFMSAVNDPMDSSARQFIANVMTRRPVNAFGERVPAEGGFLVPEFLRSQVMAYMTSAIVRPSAMVLPMGSLRLQVPTLDDPSQASSSQALGGMTFAWASEGAAIASSTPAFGRTVLEARKAAALITAPNELVDDAAGAFGDFLARVVAMGYSWFEDDAFFNGTGVGEPQGLINAPCAVATTRQSGSTVQFLDVVGMFKSLHPASKGKGMTPGVTSTAWLLSSSAMDQILELNYQVTIGMTTTPIAPPGWFEAGDGDQVGPSMLGLPAFVTDHQPALGTAGDVILADLSNYLIGDRMEMLVERSAAGPTFISDTSDFRVKARVDGRYWIQSAETTEAGQQVSPVVVLH